MVFNKLEADWIIKVMRLTLKTNNGKENLTKTANFDAVNLQNINFMNIQKRLVIRGAEVTQGLILKLKIKKNQERSRENEWA